MKNGKRPTLKQKKMLKLSRLNPENWLVVKNEPEKITIMHRHTGKTRTLASKEEHGR